MKPLFWVQNQNLSLSHTCLKLIYSLDKEISYNIDLIGILETPQVV